ncbi:NEDD4-binding protein 1 [Xiphophorus couchianus]|uniref:NEDD4-binding protein 1 n=1 Tax=Xiphophorus couchianus TaxID=32473 RepID=UPI001015FF0E|nr:NEDD4-binding protein 1-like [Xiphophorus couchianus]XP_027893671.1 NEDD4-binding protein 1-like [Xiphophorus couchianus]XP_027893672.1 NEDD4-binding protein 1-like [Xiphophorus couchianus]XP_027893673.1 NEDD4-binding protein 1-like [Xiphophorus couchianus]
MDGKRSSGGEGGSGDPEIEDEFACTGMLRGSLTSLHSTVERIFRVTFGIGADDLPNGNNGQIWLKLQGLSTDVKAAKLFVKGVVNQEVQQELSYPGALHCIFCGARGLFMDSLIKNTSALIVVGSPGFLLVSGLAEPVVRAYSLIADLVARYEGTQSKRTEMGDRVLGESLDSRRAFKTLVEKWEDRHVLDLLVLPGTVKEILLDLVKESGLGSSPSPEPMHDNNTGAKSHKDSRDDWDKASSSKKTLPDPFSNADRWAEGKATTYDSAAKDPFLQDFFSPVGTRGKAEGAEERLLHSPQEVGEEEQLEKQATGVKAGKGQGDSEEPEWQLSMGNKEFWLLLKFFTAMGYTEDVVKRVLKKTGPKEASQILDLVQQEQDLSDREQNICSGTSTKKQDGVILHQGKEQPCETEHKEDEDTGEAGHKIKHSNGDFEGVGGEELAIRNHKHSQGRGSEDVQEAEQQEDFVLGVMKKAAATCGYTEENVTKIYSMLAEGSTHQLLLELQKKESKETEGSKKEPREIHDVLVEKEETNLRLAETEAKGKFFIHKEKTDPDEGQTKEPKRSTQLAESDLCTWSNKPKHLAPNQPISQLNQPLNTFIPHQDVLQDVKGPPMPTYASSLGPPLMTFHPNKQQGQTTYRPDPATSKQTHQTHNNAPNSKRHSARDSKQEHPAQPNVFFASDPPSNRARDKRSFMSPSSSVVVTGEQRFLEGLQSPFQLKLTDKSGNPNLRAIVIDGSNVAMSHGLGHFFSCRGIALAVQHFWDRGHRHISALVPQWRQKNDPRIKEQHYMTDLQNLGLLSYTPSREVHGKRISSYDDRLILQLAQKTDGVIVTNDNLRDLLDESPVWRDIIKKRLLQYTFVGDLFMVPDDPLGRGGPHLDDFLRSEHRTPDPGNHSFAGLASTFPSTKPPRSQTEPLNFRDRTPGGAVDSLAFGGRGRGRRWEAESQHRQLGAGGHRMTVTPERNPEETAHLREQLLNIFEGQDNMVTLVLQCHLAERDINVLSDLILEQHKD